MVTRIPYSGMECNANYLKVKQIENETEYRVLIKEVYAGCIKKRVPIATQKYFCGDHME